MFLILHFHDELLSIFIRAIDVVDQCAVVVVEGHLFFVEKPDVFHLPFAFQQGVQKVDQHGFVDLLSEDQLEAYVGKGVDEFWHGLLSF